MLVLLEKRLLVLGVTLIQHVQYFRMLCFSVTTTERGSTAANGIPLTEDLPSDVDYTEDTK